MTRLAAQAHQTLNSRASSCQAVSEAKKIAQGRCRVGTDLAHPKGMLHQQTYPNTQKQKGRYPTSLFAK
ncbi:MAG: hypothetical protein KTR14_01985 [Vampirovibrio sp.]|nr:hypothetical protein [Vampirovibrio sp.]